MPQTAHPRHAQRGIGFLQRRNAQTRHARHIARAHHRVRRDHRARHKRQWHDAIGQHHLFGGGHFGHGCGSLGGGLDVIGTRGLTKRKRDRASGDGAQ